MLCTVLWNKRRNKLPALRSKLRGFQCYFYTCKNIIRAIFVFQALGGDGASEDLWGGQKELREPSPLSAPWGPLVATRQKGYVIARINLTFTRLRNVWLFLLRGTTL